MTDLIRSKAALRSIVALGLAALFMLPTWLSTYAQASPFDALLGSWRGSGQVQPVSYTHLTLPTTPYV